MNIRGSRMKLFLFPKKLLTDAKPGPIWTTEPLEPCVCLVEASTVLAYQAAIFFLDKVGQNSRGLCKTHAAI